MLADDSTQSYQWYDIDKRSKKLHVKEDCSVCWPTLDAEITSKHFGHKLGELNKMRSCGWPKDKHVYTIAKEARKPVLLKDDIEPELEIYFEVSATPSIPSLSFSLSFYPHPTPSRFRSHLLCLKLLWLWRPKVKICIQEVSWNLIVSVLWSCYASYWISYSLSTASGWIPGTIFWQSNGLQ